MIDHLKLSLNSCRRKNQIRSSNSSNGKARAGNDEGAGSIPGSGKKNCIIHCNIYATIIEVPVVHDQILVKVDVVIGRCWTREYRGVRVVSATNVSHHARKFNDITSAQQIAEYGVS